MHHGTVDGIDNGKLKVMQHRYRCKRDLEIRNGEIEVCHSKTVIVHHHDLIRYLTEVPLYFCVNDGTFKK